jgi:hypothetical protein
VENNFKDEAEQEIMVTMPMIRIGNTLLEHLIGKFQLQEEKIINETLRR